MIGVVVTLRFGDRFNERAVREVAAAARTTFEGMDGLRSKAFTFSAARNEAVNFYVWEAEDAARSFFDERLLEQVTGLYGVRPTVEFVQVAALVENKAT